MHSVVLGVAAVRVAVAAVHAAVHAAVLAVVCAQRRKHHAEVLDDEEVLVEDELEVLDVEAASAVKPDQESAPAAPDVWDHRG